MAGDEVQVQRGGLRVAWPVVGLLLGALLTGGVGLVTYAAKFSAAATSISDDIRHLTTAVQSLEAKSDERLRSLENKVDQHGERLSAIDGGRTRWPVSAASRTAAGP